MWLIIGFIVVVALLAWVLQRRGSSGLSSNGSTDSTPGALGSQVHRDPSSGGSMGL